MSDPGATLTGMTTLTVGQLAYLQSEVGSDYDTADLQARYDLLGSLVGVAAQVVSLKLAELESDASSFTLPGILSESNDATIRALTARLTRLQSAYQAEQDAAAAAALDPDGEPVGAGRIIRSDRGR